ncbi:dephospho-CoA kinase [soil metagenome]
MLKVGLTGSIGSGKSTVAKIFEVLGIPVYYADAEAKKLMNNHEGLRTSIISHFGDEAYTNTILNREYLAHRVFNDPAQLNILNALVHPITISHANKWMLTQAAPYIVKEAALIFESGSDKHLDYVTGVDSPEDLRRSRVMERDNIPLEKVLARESNQMNDGEKLLLCDYVIVNDEKKMLLPQVLSLHEKLLLLSANPS